MFNCFLSLFASVQHSDAYVNVLSVTYTYLRQNINGCELVLSNGIKYENKNKKNKWNIDI